MEIFEWYYFNKINNTVLRIKSSENQKTGDKLGTLNYDLHTGNISGIPTKILAFIISLFCASLPVTGFIIWRHKVKEIRKKSYKKSRLIKLISNKYQHSSARPPIIFTPNSK